MHIIDYRCSRLHSPLSSPLLNGECHIHIPSCVDCVISMEISIVHSFVILFECVCNEISWFPTAIDSLRTSLHPQIGFFLQLIGVMSATGFHSQSFLRYCVPLFLFLHWTPYQVRHIQIHMNAYIAVSNTYMCECSNEADNARKNCAI